MGKTRTHQESLISGSEYLEQLKRVASKITEPLLEKIAAQAIVFVCSIMLFLEKISLGYLTIDQSASFEEQKQSVLHLFSNDAGCLIAFLAFVLVSLFILWRGTFRIFLERVEMRKLYDSEKKRSKSHHVNIAFQQAQIGILVATVCVFSPEFFGECLKSDTIASFGFALAATPICITHIWLLCNLPLKPSFSKEFLFFVLRKTVAVASLISIATITLLFVSKSNYGFMLPFICFFYFAYQSIWLVAYGVAYIVDLKNEQTGADSKKHSEKPIKRKTLLHWRVVTAFILIPLLALFLCAMCVVFISLTKALVGVIPFAYQLLAFLGL